MKKGLLKGFNKKGKIICVCIFFLFTFVGNIHAQFTHEILNQDFSTWTVAGASSTVSSVSGGYYLRNVAVTDNSGGSVAWAGAKYVMGSSTNATLELPELTFVKGGEVYVEYGCVGSNREYSLGAITAGSGTSSPTISIVGISGGNGAKINQFSVAATANRNQKLTNTLKLSATDFNGAKRLLISFIGGSASILLKVVVRTSYSAPDTQASNISFANVINNSMTVNWTSGNGTSRAVFIKEEGGTIETPVDGTTYNASADWSSKGTQLGTSGYYCVYNGTGTSVDLTNLDLSKSYTVQIFEYNGTTTGSVFLTTTATDNPKTQASTLPISLTSFKTSAQADGINLNWATSSENNADKFVIERRLATSAFVGINEVKAKGKASNYAFADKNVANGETYYYRLKMVDNDGTFKYSSLSSVNFTLNNVQTFAVYPNPATNSITVSYPQTGNAVYGLTITDTKGAILLTSSVPANSTQKTIDISTLKQGIYIININTKEGRKTLKLVKH